MTPRSLLFVPGDRPERMEKAAKAGADGVILDLEDSVAPANKSYARQSIGNFLAGGIANDVDVIVRINQLDTDDCRQDVDIVNSHRVAAVMLPKSEGAVSVIELLRMLAADIPILPIAAETPSSLFSLGSYANVSKHLAGITWGAEDLAASLGSTSSRASDGRLLSPLETARNLTLFAARAAGTTALESVYANVHDIDGLIVAAMRAANEGFAGMMAIHPSQVPAINAAFSPTIAQVAEAEEIIALFENKQVSGVVVRNGKMLDAPHLKLAHATIARAKRLCDRMK